MVDFVRGRRKVPRPPQSMITTIASSPSFSYYYSSTTAASMTNTETVSSHSHDVDTNHGGDISSYSIHANLDIQEDSRSTKTAASDILDLVNDAAASAAAAAAFTSEVKVGIPQNYSDEKTSDKVPDYNNGNDDNNSNNTTVDVDDLPPPSLSAKDVALDILALENNAAASAASFEGDANAGGLLPFAPMMTYQKYLTMQEKRVKVTIRYSAEAGLRPFYLTVADQIKSAHPDVLLEKRILPRVAGGGGGADEAVFEVIVDGRTIIGKKKTRMLKVSPSSISSSSRGGGGSKSSLSSSSGSGEEEDDDIVNVVGGGNIISEEREDNRRSNARDIAGGRTIFIGMERLAAELAKARKKRRPNTTYRTESLREQFDVSGGMNAMSANNSTARSSKMTEAVIRLERLKAMGGARNNKV